MQNAAMEYRGWKIVVDAISGGFRAHAHKDGALSTLQMESRATEAEAISDAKGQIDRREANRSDEEY